MDAVGETKGVAWSEHGCEIINISARVEKHFRPQICIVDSYVSEDFLDALTISVGILKNLYKINMNRNQKITLTCSSLVAGKSMGLPLFMALHSALTKNPLSNRVVMCGEITHKGEILPVGRIKEKISYVKDNHEGWYQAAIVPTRNIKQVMELGTKGLSGVRIFPASRVNSAVMVFDELAQYRTPTFQ